MSDYNEYDSLNNIENEADNTSEDNGGQFASGGEQQSEEIKDYNKDAASDEEILEGVEFADETESGAENKNAAKNSSSENSSYGSENDSYVTGEYYAGSSSSANTDKNVYTTAEGNGGSAASYEWNNGQYSGRYSTGSYTDSQENRRGYNSYGSYSSGSYGSQNYGGSYGSAQQNRGYTGSSNRNYDPYTGAYTGGRSYGQQTGQNGSYYSNSYVNPVAKPPKAPKAKKEKKTVRVSAAIFAVCILASGVLGFGGGMLANYLNGGSSGGNGMTINKVVTTAEEASSGSGEMSTSDIVAATKNSVVEITTEIVTTGSFLQQYIESGAGSGVIVSENGYIITNNHVIEDASSITVTLADGTSYSAELVGTDADLDVALIKIDATGLDPAEIGDSSTSQAGDKAVVIGNPLGQLGGSVTQGIISSVSREVMIDGVSHNVMQVDASINPGNSGGGLFNGRGELVGIIIAKSVDESVEGIGFAIPINDVSDVLEDLMQYGYVRGKVSLGMSFVDITNAQTAMMYRVSELGCYVSSVEINSNAANAGFQSGDRITSVNGTSVSTSSDIENEINKLSVGDTVEFTVERNGRTGTLSLVLEEAIPEGIASQDDENSGSNGIRDSFGDDYDPYESTGSADDYYYYYYFNR